LRLVLLLLVLALPGRAWAHHFGPGSGLWAFLFPALFLLAIAVIVIWGPSALGETQHRKDERPPPE
jgi:hypothetical protein